MAAPGWYVDPNGESRWWDGAVWGMSGDEFARRHVEGRAEAVSAPAPAAAPVPEPANAPGGFEALIAQAPPRATLELGAPTPAATVEPANWRGRGPAGRAPIRPSGRGSDRASATGSTRTGSTRTGSTRTGATRSSVPWRGIIVLLVVVALGGGGYALWQSGALSDFAGGILPAPDSAGQAASMSGEMTLSRDLSTAKGLVAQALTLGQDPQSALDGVENFPAEGNELTVTATGPTQYCITAENAAADLVRSIDASSEIVDGPCVGTVAGG